MRLRKTYSHGYTNTILNSRSPRKSAECWEQEEARAESYVPVPIIERRH